MTKTQNSNLELKIQLRRTVLKAGGFKKLRVLDLFAGGGEIWTALRQEFKVESYMPCDAEPQFPGTAQVEITPLFVEAICNQPINVVDIESDGEPWETWAAVARRIDQPAAVFLENPTGPLSDFARSTAGIPRAWAIEADPELNNLVARFFLTPVFEKVEITAAWRLALGKATSFGLLARPAEA